MDSNSQPSTSSNLSRSAKRRQHSDARALAFRRAKNQEFQDALTARLEAKFALPEGFVFPAPAESFKQVASGSAEIGDSSTLSGDSLTVPLPVPTDSLQLITSNFYDAMLQSVPTPEDLGCSFDQFNRVVQLQLLNKIHPNVPEDDPSTSTSDLTSETIQLPNAIQRIINSAVPFELPISKVSNGSIVSSGKSSLSPVKRIIFNPVIIDNFKGLNKLSASRFSNIMTIASDLPLQSRFYRRLLCGVKPDWLKSDFLAVRRLLAKIPGDAHGSWKVDGVDTVGTPQTFYLLYGPVTWIIDPNVTQTIYEPPVTSSRVLYRLTGRENGLHYELFSSPENDIRVFESNYRRIMERAKVQRLFRDVKRIPMNSDSSIFLKY